MLAVLCLPLLIVSLDNTVLNVALPTLVRKLHAGDSELQWIVDAYVISFGGLMLVSGSLADRVGRKRTFLAGLAIFAVCSTWAAFSGSAEILIAARACMGVGATLIMPSTLSIITNTFGDPRERQRALGIWAGTSGAGVSLGPIVGGLLLAHFDWGSVFLINVPIAALALVLGGRFVPDSRNETALAPDVSGSLLSVAGLGLLLWAVIEAPVHGWTSAEVLASGGVGVGVLVLFAAWEGRTSHPMLQVAFFRKRAFSAAVTGTATMMFALMGSLFVLTQFLQFQLGNTPLLAGVHMLPAAGGIAVVAPFSPILVRRLSTKLTVATGLLLVAGGLLQVAGATVHSTYSSQLPGTIMIGIGAGFVMPACVGSLVGTLPLEHTGIGSATNGSFLNIGGALGVAIVGSLMSSRYQHQVAAALSGHARGSLGSILALHPLPAAAHGTVLGSLGGALSVAERAGGILGLGISRAARAAFIDGMGLGLEVGAAVVLAGVLIALIALPMRPGGSPERPVVSSHGA